MEFLGIPIFDNDFYKMMFRLGIDLFFLTIIIRVLYDKERKKVSYTFTYFLIGIIVFFLCFTLKKFELDIGMALGLFAIFGIIRYRTAPIEIKEMTYLFVVIGVSVINALANSKMSYAEIFGANTIITLAIYLLERMIMKNSQERSITMTYEKIKNIHFENDEAFIEDIKERLGLDIIRYEIQSVDYLKDSADLTLYYQEK